MVTRSGDRQASFGADGDQNVKVSGISDQAKTNVANQATKQWPGKQDGDTDLLRKASSGTPLSQPEVDRLKQIRDNTPVANMNGQTRKAIGDVVIQNQDLKISQMQAALNSGNPSGGFQPPGFVPGGNIPAGQLVLGSILGGFLGAGLQGGFGPGGGGFGPGGGGFVDGGGFDPVLVDDGGSDGGD